MIVELRSNYVFLRTSKLAVTTAHDPPTVSTDAIWTLDDDALTKVSWVITHIWPQEPPTAPKAVSADHSAAFIVEAAATLNGRSDASCGRSSLVWIHYDASHTDRIKRLKAARLSCFAAHVTHVETGEKELHGSAGKQSGAVRGPLCLPG